MSGDHRLTLKQACELLGKKERTVRRYVQTGLLSKVYVDGDNGWELRLSETEVRALASGATVSRPVVDQGTYSLGSRPGEGQQFERPGPNGEPPHAGVAESLRGGAPEGSRLETAETPYVAVTGVQVAWAGSAPEIPARPGHGAPSHPAPWHEITAVRSLDDPGRLRLSAAFGRFFEQVQREHEDGRDAYLLGLDEALAQERRGDASAPGKGVWVLHMLRRALGDKRLWRALERFAQEYGFDRGTTEQFRRILEDEVGVESADRGRLARFAPWFEHAGLPHLSAAWRWDPTGPGIRLTLAQTPDPLISDEPPLYTLPLTIRCFGPQGERSFAVTMAQREEEFCFQMTLRPRLVLVDPDHDLALVVQASKRTEEWLEQLRRGPDALHRVRAIDGLRGAWGAPDVEAALRDVVYADPCGGVRAAAARALAPVAEPWSAPARPPGGRPAGVAGVLPQDEAGGGRPPSPPTPLPIMGEGSLPEGASPDSPSPGIGRGGWGVRAGSDGESVETQPVSAEVEQLKRELRRLRAEQAQIERALVLLELRTRPRVSEEPREAATAGEGD